MSGLRERKKAKTRDALVREALRLFDERGFDHVTVEEIVERCDVSPRTFFRYFASKEDVLFIERASFRDLLLAALEAQPDDVSPLPALQAAVLAVAREFEEHRETLLLRRRIITSTPALSTRAAERHHGWESAIIAELRRTGRDAGLSDLELRLMVAASATALRVATEVWIEHDGRGDLGALLVEALDLLRDGLEATQGVSPEPS